MGSQEAGSQASAPNVSWSDDKDCGIKVGTGPLCSHCVNSRIMRRWVGWHPVFCRFDRRRKHVRELRGGGTGWENKSYGTLVQLFGRKSCPICALILQSLPQEAVLEIACGGSVGVDSRAHLQIELRNNSAAAMSIWFDGITPGTVLFNRFSDILPHSSPPYLIEGV